MPQTHTQTTKDPRRYNRTPGACQDSGSDSLSRPSGVSSPHLQVLILAAAKEMKADKLVGSGREW